MRTKDHLALGKYLWHFYMNNSNPINRAAFLIGSVEPDFNYATYLRGFKTSHELGGHNQENTAVLILRGIKQLREKRCWSAGDFFTAGTLMHYIADSFTWPHTASFCGNLQKHVSYEHRLHYVIVSEISSGIAAPVPYIADFPAYLDRMHTLYMKKTADMQIDSRFIIHICSTLFYSIVRSSICAGKTERIRLK